jgi:hypothetical protein
MNKTFAPLFLLVAFLGPQATLAGDRILTGSTGYTGGRLMTDSTRNPGDEPTGNVAGKFLTGCTSISDMASMYSQLLAYLGVPATP